MNVYSVDVCGLRVGKSGPCGNDPLKLEFLQTLSDNTGGRAIVNTNDMEPGIVQMFRENNSYYLVGYSPVNVRADGTFRRLEVKVDRPDVEVRTRKNYYAPDEKAAAKEAALPQPSANVKALTGILPKGDVSLRVTAAPFATADPKMSTVAMALGVERPADGSNRGDDVDVIVDAFAPEGQAKGSSKQTVHVAGVLPSSDNKLQYDLLSHIELPPGRYELRFGAHSGALGKDGSVYADVEVPDFAKEPLSLSGVVLSAVPGLTSAPKGAVSEIVPIVPTSLREFDRGYRVTSFLRVYEGGKNALAPVTVAIRIVNDQDASVFEESQTIGVDRFDAKARAADERVELPLARLAPGAYLLTFEATLGKNTTRRDVRFSVK
jgi:hypothetical protein